MVDLFANSGDPDQTPQNAASDLGLHCLPVTPLGVSRLQWVNNTPIQIYRKFHLQKTENFQIKNSDIFLISAGNIDCWYLLELPQ